MTLLDDKIGPKVAAAILRVGVSVDIRRPPLAADYDSDTGSVSGSGTSFADRTVTMRLEYTIREIDGETVIQGDTYVMKAGTDSDTGYTPRVNDEITFVDAQIWRVMHVIPYESGDKVAAYKLQLRRIKA